MYQQQNSPPLRAGYWAIAGTPSSWPYPCRCDEDMHWSDPISRRCSCYGRRDLSNVPRQCCAARLARRADWSPR